ncbi:TonB-dependent siderophore receptor [Novosphingobium flavum]|uniref:TonB-dependent siderophore receptor n=1 Tax=Novosphingobium flavum TaxID=1778672 RepID=A0A7X1FR43_9SPHN|nr:TonB-dependent siderophore receptor [Novosphingobium flavum]MBC2665440.1 TonB-dependent siderophore receptor [Novosphingobium flavum]
MTALIPALLAAAAANSTPAVADFSLMAASAAADAAAEEQRDATIVVTGQRTEGNEDYGVAEQRTATRLPLSQKETPQSVSVVTRAQIDDFQLNDVNQLLATVPGVNVLAAETDRVYYSARGYDIQTFQIDGVGMPFAFGIQTGSLDTAIYDRIEVVRGAPGLLTPTGNPSAVVNFIRKRPYRDLRASVSAQYGSYDNLRLDGDISVPLTSDGSVRARAVGAYLDTDSYLDRYHLGRWTGYGIVEADLGPDTVASAGFAYQHHQSRAAQWGAVPLYYTDGTRVDFARSDNTGPDWAGWGVTERQIFGDLTHHWGEDWTATLTVLRRANDENDKLFYVYGNPDRETGDGIYTYPGAFRGQTRNLTIDAHVAGKLSIGGRKHDVLFGAVRSAEGYIQDSAYDYSTVGVPISLDQLFSGTFPEPDFPDFTESLNINRKQETVYGLVRLNLADPFKVMLGGNYTHASSDGTSYGTPQNYDRKKFLPFAGATFDVTANVTLYASYATIFNPQTEFDANNRLLDPIEGDNIEAGVKGEFFGGGLLATAAVFRARQNNTAQAAGFDTVLGRTIYAGVDSRSEGVEFELAGSPAQGLQLTGGFTTMRIRDENGDPARTFVPRTTAKFNATYSPPALSALKLGASLQYQSGFYFDPGTVSSTTGETVRLEQEAYALLDLLVSYAITPRVTLSANVRNVTDVKYLTSLTFEQGYYGAPRTVLGTLTVKY